MPTLPILKVNSEDLPDRVLVVGDPARAEAAAVLLDGGTELARNREYVTYTGRHRDVPVAVVSHGVGAAGAAICFEELCRGGAKLIVRAGTAGGLQETVQDGDVVIATGAVRDEGVTPRIVPLGYPALADLDTVQGLRSAADAQGVPIHTGIVLSYDLFYPHPVLGGDLELWNRAGAVAVEMECSTLFVIAAQHGVRTAAVLAIDGNPLAQDDTDMAGYDPYREIVRETVESVLTVALGALADTTLT